MTTTLLFATDFSLESLNILKKVLKEKEDLKNESTYNIVLVCGYEMGDSVRELLFSTKTSVFSKIRPEEFDDALSIIKNKYPYLINKITCDIFTGYFQKSFSNFIEAKGIDEAYYPSVRMKRSKKKFDLSPYIKKCRTLKSYEIYVETAAFLPEKGRLAEVFV